MHEILQLSYISRKTREKWFSIIVGLKLCSIITYTHDKKNKEKKGTIVHGFYFHNVDCYSRFKVLENLVWFSPTEERQPKALACIEEQVLVWS